MHQLIAHISLAGAKRASKCGLARTWCLSGTCLVRAWCLSGAHAMLVWLARGARTVRV